MSIVPLIVQSVLDGLECPRRYLHDQNFGLGLLNDDLLFSPQSVAIPLRSGYLRTARPHRHSQKESGVSTIKNEEKTFKIELDVQQFKPEEISVKVAEGFITIEGKHEEREDEHGFISRQFVRKYQLPNNVVTDEIASTISSDGILSVTAPKAISMSHEKNIPVVQTNKPALKKQESKEKNEKMES